MKIILAAGVLVGCFLLVAIGWVLAVLWEVAWVCPQ